MRYLYCIILLISFSIVQAQNKGHLLVILDTQAEVFIDGESKGKLVPSVPIKYELSEGEHYVQAKCNDCPIKEKSEILSIEKDKQKVFKIEFLKGVVNIAGQAEIEIAKLDFSITGALAVGFWLADNPNKEYPNYPNYFYAFEEGDDIELDFSMKNKNGTNVIVVSTYPDGNVVYSNNSVTELKKHRIKVEKRSIYRFAFATNAALDRNCNLVIRRIPKNEETKNFKSNVIWKKTYDTTYTYEGEYKFVPVTIQKPTYHYVNSSTNIGGKTRITIPVNLPQNTVSWYYIISAYRDESKIKEIQNKFNLFGELTRLVDKTGVLSVSINALSTPPGEDYCDVYLINYENLNPFLNKEAYRYYLEGSRENIKFGAVEIKSNGLTNGNFYLGLRNPDSRYGVNIAIEVVAVTIESTGNLIKVPVSYMEKNIPIIDN